MMRLISAPLDRSRAEVTINIDLGDEEGPLVLTYSTDRRAKGETAQQYRARIRSWLAQVSREARLIADTKVPKSRTIEDVKSDIEPAFV